MKTNIILFALIGLVLLFIPDNAFGQTKGHELVKWMKEYEKGQMNDHSVSWVDVGMYMGYINGILDAEELMFNVPQGTTRGQTNAIVTKYIKNNPEHWHEYAHILVSMAFLEAWGPSDLGMEYVKWLKEKIND